MFRAQAILTASFRTLGIAEQINQLYLHHFLAQDLDQLLISVPLNKATRHLLGKAEFEILSKRNAFVINVARGEIIIQEGLIQALNAYENDTWAGGRRKGLRGAALDVTTPEPLPKDHPL